MEVKERIINLLGDRLGINELEIKETSDFIADLGVDSLDMIEIVMDIEKEFGLKVKDEEIPEIKTVGDLVDKVEEMRRR